MRKRRREILIMGGGPVGDPDMANVSPGVVVGISFLLFAALRSIQ